MVMQLGNKWNFNMLTNLWGWKSKFTKFLKLFVYSVLKNYAMMDLQGLTNAFQIVKAQLKAGHVQGGARQADQIAFLRVVTESLLAAKLVMIFLMTDLVVRQVVLE